MTMTIDQAGNLLTLAASFDKRTIGELDITVWHSALRRFDFPACAEAIVQHYSTTTDYLLPVHISRIVAQARKEFAIERESTAAGTDGHCGRPSCQCTHQSPCDHGWIDSDDNPAGPTSLNTVGHCPTCHPGRAGRPGETRQQWMARLQRQDMAWLREKRKKYGPDWQPGDNDD